MIPVPGDLLFYRGNPRQFIDRLVMQRTGSVWVHVAIQDSNGLVVEAVSGGVRRVGGGAPRRAPDAVAQVGVDLALANAARFNAALAALRQRVGDRYGFGDIVDQVLVLLPGHPVLKFDRSADCSDLAASFLLAAGYALPFDFDPTAATPGSLATLLGVTASGT